MVNSVAPILLVDAIEPSIPFWVDGLGFEKTSEVPEQSEGAEPPAAGARLGFVMLTSGDYTVMYQTRKSVEQDLPALLEGVDTHAQMLYLVVERLDEVIARLEGADGVSELVPVRETFYGMREWAVREPGGHSVVFAQSIRQ